MTATKVLPPTLLAAAIVINGIASTAEAATITNIPFIALPGFSTGNVSTSTNPAPNNDNTSAPSPNVIPFTVFLNAGGLGIMETEFALTNSGGTTEYRFTQTLINNTGRPWTDFHFELGFGTGASFVRSGDLDGLDFDTPERDPAATSSMFPLLTHQSDTLDWQGATVPSIGVVLFTFAIDVPDNLSAFHPTQLNRFTLRQFATVPEPGLMALLGTGLLLLRRRR